MAKHARMAAGAIMGIHAQSSLHAGTGAAIGVVDLPIQRERHTGWPCVGGSAIKGILRDAAREHAKAEHGGDRAKANDSPGLVRTFGPGRPDEDSAAAGALSVTDARILAFPVRSMKGVFAWVTCPSVLQRFARDAAIAGHTIALDGLPSPASGQCSLSPNSPCEENRRVILEEFDFQCGAQLPGPKMAVLKNLFPESDSFSRESFGCRLILLCDDDFTHFARHGTEVAARIALNYETKTVNRGALFYQEFLPPESLLYCLLLADGSRAREPQGQDAAGNGSVLGYVEQFLPRYLQIGGDETTGKGLCAVQLWKGVQQ